MATPLPTNHVSMSLTEVAQATGGTLFGPPEMAISGISTDTRTAGAGALFIALRGENHDGHDYAGAAMAAGAGAVLCDHGRLQVTPRVEVADTQRALGDLAHFHSRRLRKSGSVVCFAVGGAAGKTTTKEIAAAMARELWGNVLATPGNLNNLIGAPLTLLQLLPEHRAMVIECGTNSRGEIARLGEIVEPDVALVLNVDLEHTEGLGSLEGVADEEAALLHSAQRCAVTSVDEPLLMSRLPRSLEIVTFGTGAGAMARLQGWKALPAGGSHISVELAGRLTATGRPALFEAELGMVGEAAARNATAALAAMAAASPLSEDQMAAIASALAGLRPVSGRMAIRTIAGLTVIDDSYNSNPRSLQAALSASKTIAARHGARLLLALGDMLELGEFADTAHREALRQALDCGAAAVVVAGPLMAKAAVFISADVKLAPNSEAAAVSILAQVERGDVVLVKGSRGMRMERVVEALEKIGTQ